MKNLSTSDLKTILHSKRANLYYLEYCRVMQKGGRVLYLTEAKKEKHHFNIPIANTTVILLGNGTSITKAAVRMVFLMRLPYLACWKRLTHFSFSAQISL